MSRIVRESTPLDTAKAIREGMLALISPVMTLTEGRWVAITRWIPQARASWARRQIASSTSPGATIIRSASSSTMITIWGSFESFAASSAANVAAALTNAPLYFRSMTVNVSGKTNSNTPVTLFITVCSAANALRIT